MSACGLIAPTRNDAQRAVHQRVETVQRIEVRPVQVADVRQQVHAVVRHQARREREHLVPALEHRQPAACAVPPGRAAAAPCAAIRCSRTSPARSPRSWPSRSTWLEPARQVGHVDAGAGQVADERLVVQLAPARCRRRTRRCGSWRGSPAAASPARRGARPCAARADASPAPACMTAKPSDVGERDVPAAAQPGAHGARLRKQVGDRDARGRAEPDHRAAEADRVGEHAPVVAALLQRELGERDVVEHGRDEARARAPWATTPPAAARPASSTPRAPATAGRSCPAAWPAAPTSPAGATAAVARIATQTAAPRNGKRSAYSGNRTLVSTLTAIAASRISATIADPAPVDADVPVAAALHDRRMRVLLQRGRDAAHDQRDARRHVGMQHVERAHAVDPHHGRGGVADHAARAARVRRRHERRDVTDVHLAAGTRWPRPCRRSARPRCCRGSSTARTPSPAAGTRRASRPAGSPAASPARGSASKCRDSSANPISRPNRLASTTHSACRWPTKPAEARRPRGSR